MDNVEFSVVIPAYLGALTIVACVESVLRAAGNRRCEVIVVESSGDQTADLLGARFPQVTVIQSPTRLTAGGARNRGMAQARAGVIYFTDQDCLVPPDWFDRLGGHLADPSVGAAGGSVGIANPSNLSGCAVYFLEFLRHFPGAGRARRGNFLVGCNSAYRAEMLHAVNFPDQTLGEDVIFSDDLQKHGFGVVYDPGIEVRHHNRAGWGEFFRYNREMGTSAAMYHAVVRRWWITPFLRVPSLAFVAPAVILPSIAINLARSRWSYLLRFLWLSPICLAGNLVWANAFRQQVLRMHASGSIRPSG